MPNRKQILALSGGGFRGLYSARLLEKLEERLGGKRIGSCFDLIAGTSIGGIIGLAVAAEIPASVIRQTIESVGPRLFQKRPKKILSTINGLLLRLVGRANADARMLVNRLLEMPYDPTPLREALMGMFGDRRIVDLKHDVIVPVVNFSTGAPKVFKTPHKPEWSVDKNRKLVDVALATSAAPVFFPNHEIDGARYVDGGLIANGPTLFALHEAFLLDWPLDETYMLSIGTLDVGACDSSHTTLEKGLAEWGEKLFMLTIAAQEQSAHYMSGHQLGDRFLRIDETVTKDQSDDVGFDKADPAAISTLKMRADERFQQAIAKPQVQSFLSHNAVDPVRF